MIMFLSLCLFGSFRLYLSPSGAEFLVVSTGRVLSFSPSAYHRIRTEHISFTPEPANPPFPAQSDMTHTRLVTSYRGSGVSIVLILDTP